MLRTPSKPSRGLGSPISFRHRLQVVERKGSVDCCVFWVRQSLCKRFPTAFSFTGVEDRRARTEIGVLGWDFELASLAFPRVFSWNRGEGKCRNGGEMRVQRGPGGLDLTQAFFKPISNAEPPSPTKRHSKITVVGVGNVGMAIAQTILTQDLADELALVDAKADKLRGEMLDLQHAAAFLPRTKIQASPDYDITAGSDLCVITAGARQIPGESRLNLIQRNLSLFKSIVPPLAKYSPECILLIVSNPVDVLTYVAWKLSGFPANRVIGSGTNLDSSRFRFLIADHLDVNAQDVQAYIVGEHGDSSVALWSSISVGGVPVLSFLKRQQIVYEKETLENIHKSVVEGAYEVIRLKGYTSWAIGYSVASLARTILRDQRKIHPVSVLAKGFYDIDGGDVFLSLPAQLGRSGVLGVTNVHLTDEEAQQLRNSAKAILEVQIRSDSGQLAWNSVLGCSSFAKSLGSFRFYLLHWFGGVWPDSDFGQFIPASSSFFMLHWNFRNLLEVLLGLVEFLGCSQSKHVMTFSAGFALAAKNAEYAAYLQGKKFEVSSSHNAAQRSPTGKVEFGYTNLRVALMSSSKAPTRW
ncbi:unnamed protein product [Fraxinus pennsylvanica]|uniref:L-lactate dehydrogenase n=1 Tax=Fraxinus pennsylvanica TaxID=56036 RepID=A0AAD2ABS9_9LAMI|nr:unnamed protein product [Fraxinus pennsylvanica]